LTAKVAGEPSMEQMRALRASTSMRSLTSPKEVPSMLQARRGANSDGVQAVPTSVSGAIDKLSNKCSCDLMVNIMFFADPHALGHSMYKFADLCDKQTQGPAEATCGVWRHNHIR
jgi:hypothetical protein